MIIEKQKIKYFAILFISLSLPLSFLPFIFFLSPSISHPISLSRTPSLLTKISISPIPYLVDAINGAARNVDIDHCKLLVAYVETNLKAWLA